MNKKGELMKADKHSFTAAGIFPAKLLKTKVIDKKGRIMPVHIQLNPSNRCNFSCPFCSCRLRNKSLELPFEEHYQLLKTASEIGCRAVTITGGGEPLLYSKINELLETCNQFNIKAGLVTNGSLFEKLNTCKHLTWCRISASDYLQENLKRLGMNLNDWLEGIKTAVDSGKRVDWSFSYVLTSAPDYKALAEIVKFANNHNFTHVRIVSDLTDLESVPEMSEVKRKLSKKLNDDLVIYQGRKAYTKGREKCLISLLKPVIGADGMIYPCCGAQYSLEEPSLDYPEKLRMGHWSDLKKIFEEQRYFNGSICKRCYYDQYNWALDIMTKKLRHEEFV